MEENKFMNKEDLSKLAKEVVKILKNDEEYAQFVGSEVQDYLEKTKIREHINEIDELKKEFKQLLSEVKGKARQEP